MTPNLRFRLWIVFVVLSVSTPHIWFASRARTSLWDVTCIAIIVASLTAIAVLVVTTPSDAIRLTAVRSLQILTVFTAVLYTHAWHRFDCSAHGAWATIAACLSAAGFSIAAVRAKTTPWWVAVIAWNPLAVGPYAVTPWMIGALMSLLAVILWTRYAPTELTP